MKRLLLLLLLMLAVNALGQPIRRNSITTNVLGSSLFWDPSIKFLTITDTSGGFSVLSNAITVVTISPIPGGNSLPALNLDQYLQFKATTNRLTISSTNTLLLDNVPIVSGGATTTNTVINVTTINIETNIFTVGKGGSLTLNTFVLTNYIQFPWTTLSYASTSNITVNLTNSMFKLTLTNNAYFGVPTGLPGTNLAQTIQIALLQDGTGTRTVTMTNAAWLVAGSGASTNAVPTINTNANGVTILTFVTSPFSSTLLYGVPTAFTP